MTTTADSFAASGPAFIGFEARTWRRPAIVPSFTFGALAVGSAAGVYGAIDDITVRPMHTNWEEAGIVGTSTDKHGVFGFSGTRYGVMGQSGAKPTTAVFPPPPPAAGVMGLAKDADGVVGVSQWSQGAGVKGLSNWTAISAISAWGTAVNASTFSGSAAISAYTGGYGAGVDAQSGDGVGVSARAANNTGVFGVSGSAGPTGATVPNVAGVVGTSDQNRGVIGKSNLAQGVYGFSRDNAGVVGESGAAASYGGYFFGNVHVTGTLTAGGKMAVVRFPDGTQRVLCCMESPEYWFEDFGAAKLKRGGAIVKLDGDFAKVIKRGDYHVFLTPRGDCRGLYVRRQGGASFEVRELGGGTSSAAFSYRIVGLRNDIKGHRRFAKIDTRLPVPRVRPARTARRAKMPPRTPAALRAFAARMEKEARAQMRKRGRKGKGSARRI